MKKSIFTRPAALLTSLAMFTVLALTPVKSALSAGAGSTVYKNTRQIADNLEYINSIEWNSDKGRNETFALRLSGAGDVYPIVMNCDTIYGKFTISKMVSYAESLGKNVVAALNTDFFSMQTGVPFGIVIENGVYKSSPGYESAVCFMPDGSVYFAEDAGVNITLTNNGGSNPGETVDVINFNKYRMDTGGLYLYSSAFSTVSTRTSSEGWFVRLKILEGSPAIGGEMQLMVEETFISEGAFPIDDGYLILTAATGSGYIEEYEKFAPGDLVTMTITSRDRNLAFASYATGGGDRLIKNGTITDPSGWDKDIASARAPRTAVGIRADGSVMFYVLDGRSSEHSVGKTLTELAQYMLSDGCINAVNFDGGGSTAMSVKLPGSVGCSLVSKPSDNETERACSTYILLVTDKKPDGIARRLALKNDGTIILPGSSIGLSYTGTDSGLSTISAPYDVIASSSGLGTIDGDVYTAGFDPGTDTLSLNSSSTLASGTGEIKVIAEPTSIYVRIAGQTERLSSIRLAPGESISLEAAASYYRREVTAQNTSFTFSVPENIGTVTPDGVLTASNSPGASGVLNISVGSAIVVIPVEVGGFNDMKDHWANDYVGYLTAAGVVKGMSDTEYGPELNIKRGDFVLMLYRAAGQPAVPADGEGFSDVAADAYYGSAITWAQLNGIAQGMGDGKFSPNGTLTREQAFTFVYRALGILGVPYEDADTDVIAAFTDAVKVAEYAIAPTATLVSMNVVQGSDGYLTPQSSLTRAQMAKILCVVLQSAVAENVE